MHKTTVTKPKDITRRWHLIDLKGKTLGRASSEIAKLLIGKDKPYFTGHLDVGDYVVVINAKHIHVTGRKMDNKLYQHHTGFPGGFREFTLEQMMDKDPKKVIMHSVKGMIPKNKLRAPRLKRLKIFVGSEHPYQEQIKDNQEE